MNISDAFERMPIHTDASGVIRVARTRVTLDTIVAAFEGGATAEEIALQYPSVPLVAVYSVITYYLRHKAEVDSYLTEREQLAARVRAEAEQRSPSTGIANASGKTPRRSRSMTERSLQITHRKGRPFAGYLHLPHTADGERTRSVATSAGILVVDYNTADEPIGIEISAPQNVSAERLNDVLSSLGQPALVDNAFAPLATGQEGFGVRELKSLAPDVVALLDERDAASRLLEALPTKYPTSQIGQVNPTRAWELTALRFFHRGRVHEALSLFWRLYQHGVCTGHRAHSQGHASGLVERVLRPLGLSGSCEALPDAYPMRGRHSRERCDRAEHLGGVLSLGLG